MRIPMMICACIARDTYFDDTPSLSAVGDHEISLGFACNHDLTF